VTSSDQNPATTQPGEPSLHHNWLYRRVALPIFALLRMGASPRKLAWSIAVGLLIGINPVLGSTTVVCLAAAFVLRLNVAASQLANHAVYPFELLFLIPFIRFGDLIFHTGPMPFSTRSLIHAARSSPIALTRQLWTWEWHALVLWFCLAVVLVPIIALSITPFLQRLLVRIEHHEYPLIHPPHLPRERINS
jgi:uncharacterized protein (DUF2062 family)